MKCKQAANLIDSYLDGRLEKDQSTEMSEHLNWCEPCHEKQLERESLFRLLEDDRQVRLPDDFTQNLMKSVLELDTKNLRKNTASNPINNSIFFRRLGISMVVSAAVMLFSMMLPLNYSVERAEQATIKTTAGIAQSTMYLSNTFYDVNYSVKSFFRNVDNTLDKYREGY